MNNDVIIITPEQHNNIINMGCSQYWINFPDGTEQYGTNPRSLRHNNRWEQFNHDCQRKRSDDNKMANIKDIIQRCIQLDKISSEDKITLTQLMQQ